MQKAEFPNEKWDIGKIFLTLVVALGLLVTAYGIKTFVLGASQGPSSNAQGSVEGLSTMLPSPSPTISLPSAQDINTGVQQNLSNIKQEVNNLNVAEVASSSPQVQKVINDVKSLPSYPSSQAKSLCVKICNGL